MPAFIVCSNARRIFEVGRSARFFEKKVGKKMGSNCTFVRTVYKFFKAFYYFIVLSFFYRGIKNEKIFKGFIENFYALGYIFEREKR